MKVKKRFGEIVLILGLFIVLYNPPLLSFNCMHFVGALSIVYLLINNCTNIKGEYVRWLALFAIIEIYLLLMVVFLRNSLSGVVFPLYYIIDVIPFSMAIKLYFDKNVINYEYIITMCFIAATVQSLLAIISFLSPQFQAAFIDRIIGFSGIEVYSYWSSLRMYGFSNGLMFEMPVVQTIIAVIALYYSSTKGWKYIALGGLFFFSAIINARTSIVVLMIGLIVLFLFSKHELKIKIRIVIGLVLSSIILIAVILPFIETTAPLTYKWITEGMGDILRFLSGNSETGYFSYVTDHNRYALPPDLLGLFLGEGITISGGTTEFGVYSDIGFINDIWIGGILYVAFLYPNVLVRLIKMCKTDSSTGKFIGVLLIALIFILNFKGRMFAMNSVLNLAVIIQLLLSGGTENVIRKQ